MICSPTKSPLKTAKCAQVPITGIDSRIALMIRSPVPESRSSGSE
jgi:hypothetical protein